MASLSPIRSARSISRDAHLRSVLSFSLSSRLLECERPEPIAVECDVQARAVWRGWHDVVRIDQDVGD